MYLPSSFNLDEPAALHALIRAHPLALVVCGGEVAQAPVLVDPDPAPRGTLRLHLARANHACDLLDREPAQLVFSGPDAYVSARWYEDPSRQVPTWNYVTVLARGRARRLDRTGLRQLLRDTAATFESGPEPWSPEVLVPGLEDELLGAIVGFAIQVDELMGKLKLSQNRSAADRARVIEALRRRGTPDDLAMVAMMHGAGMI